MSPTPTGDAAGPSSARVRLARRALLCAAALGVAADLLFRDGPFGLGLLVWMALFAAIVIALVPGAKGRLSTESAIWLVCAVGFGGTLSLRDAEPLLAFGVLAMVASLGLLALSLSGVPVAGLTVARVRDLIRAAFGTGLDVATGVMPLALRDAELHTAGGPSTGGNARRIARALVITVPLLFVFTILLTNADPVFGSFLRFVDLDFEETFSHVALAGFFTWIVAGWFRRALLSPAASATTDFPLPIALTATDLTLALGALNVLFAAFVIVQLRWLFGGEALVLQTTGLSYADYARRGFAELTGVAALLLPVLLSAQALIPAAEMRTHQLYRRLSIPLVILLGAIMVSAGARMQLYIHYYGISTDRLFASAFMIWLALVFAWLALTVLRSRPRLFATGMVATGFLVLATLNVLDPDALVARANLARGASGKTGAAGTDLRYVASLGGSAIPLVVAALTAPQGATDGVIAADRCAAAEIVLKRWTGEHRDRTSRTWAQWNSARSAALTAVRAHESELRSLACAKPAEQK